jgi:CubicO group peptidase (beta-lactamase class C family)
MKTLSLIKARVIVSSLPVLLSSAGCSKPGNNNIRLAFLILLIFAACSGDRQSVSLYDHLTDYEGVYEYSNPESLIMEASDFDTTLYAILDDARYPLNFISTDTFTDAGRNQVVFLRDEHKKIKGYRLNNETYDLLRRDFEKTKWFPRKELFGNVDAYQYQVPKNMNDGIGVGELESAFSKPEMIIEMVKQTISGNYQDVHSILIFKDNKLVLEEYFYDYDEAKPHQLRSASKSFIGTLMGIAIDQGKIKDEHEKLLPLFANAYPSVANMDPKKRLITIQDFLTYRHGMDCNDEDPSTAGHELKMLEANDWIRFALDLPMVQEPGVKSSYCTACAQTIGRLVELKTGMPLVEFADKNLFGPMNITNYKWRFQPDTTSKATFNQMYLRPRDMLRLAKMYHDKGKWNGKQIVSEEWVEKTFKKDDVEFGYLWRHKSFEVDGKVYSSYLATGNGGQKINIWPALNMITVFTGGNYNAFLKGRQTPPNEMIPQYILRAL